MRAVFAMEPIWKTPSEFAVLLVLADTAARVVLAPVEIPVGVLTALVGGPFFLVLFLKRHRGAE